MSESSRYIAEAIRSMLRDVPKPITPSIPPPASIIPEINDTATYSVLDILGAENYAELKTWLLSCEEGCKFVIGFKFAKVFIFKAVSTGHVPVHVLIFEFDDGKTLVNWYAGNVKLSCAEGPGKSVAIKSFACVSLYHSEAIETCFGKTYSMFTGVSAFCEKTGTSIEEVEKFLEEKQFTPITE